MFDGTYLGGASPVNGVNYYKTLEFTYTVGAGQNANPLDYVADTGLVQSSSVPMAPPSATPPPPTTPILLSPPQPGTGVPTAGSLSVNTDLVVTTTAPTVGSVTVNSTATPAGTYGPGTVVDVQVHFVGLAGSLATPDPVAVTGAVPFLLLNTGTANDKATYMPAA